MRLATWNVNSVRSRLDRLVAFLQRQDIDIAAIQETKVKDEAFPRERLEAAGYQLATAGFNHWNGVALLSRVGLQDPVAGFPGLPHFGKPPVAEARALSALCGGIEVMSVYIPNGREIGHPHYHYKLAWLEALRAHAAQRTADPQAQLIVCGDFNIAPTDADVWSPAYYQGRTHVTEPERAAFAALLNSGLHDLTRRFTNEPRTYTYWDYTQLRFQKKQGMRIDFALGSAAVDRRVTGARIDIDERRGTGASDHAPVIVEVSD